MKKTNAVRAYYMLPCCFLLLNLVNSVISYKAEMIEDPVKRTWVVMGLVLFGGSLVTFLVAPGLTRLVQSLHQHSKRGGGRWGEIFFLAILGGATYFLYFEMVSKGPQALLPGTWWNGAK